MSVNKEAMEYAQKKLFGNGGEKKPQTVILQGIRSRI